MPTSDKAMKQTDPVAGLSHSCGQLRTAADSCRFKEDGSLVIDRIVVRSDYA